MPWHHGSNPATGWLLTHGGTARGGTPATKDGATTQLKKRAKWLLGGLVVVVGLPQFFAPDRTNPPVVAGRNLLASNAPPTEVVRLLRSACYDCHSHETRWPWYTRVSPVSWWSAGHVHDGRKRLNFSDWPYDRPRRMRSNWRNIVDEIEDGSMPLPSYTWIHTESRLNDHEKQLLIDWAEKQIESLKAGDAEGQER